MTNESRKSGDCFEEQLISFLLINGMKYHDEYTKNKHDKLKNKGIKNDKIINKITIDDKSNDKINDNINDKNDNNNVKMNKCLSNIYNFMKFNKYITVKFTKDSDGKKGNTSDVELYDNNNNFIGISCKVNNISIKHQRPSSLYKQIGMDQQKIDEFKQEYKLCNDIWYTKFEKLLTFDKIDHEQKMSMYIDFNNIIKKYLNSCSDIQIQNYYNFLIHHNKIYILKHDIAKKKIVLYDYINTPSPTKISSITSENQNIKIMFNNNIKINMRLHNASKRITKSLSLKYDTTIIEGKLFTTHDFNL